MILSLETHLKELKENRAEKVLSLVKDSQAKLLAEFQQIFENQMEKISEFKTMVDDLYV